MKVLIGFALLLSSVPASAAKVEIATGSWEHLPSLSKHGQAHLNNNAIARIMEVVGGRKCKLSGQSYGRLDFNLSFAAHFQPNGTLERVIMPKLDCAEVEGIVGGMLLEMIQGGDYRPTGDNPEGWYRGQLAFETNF